MVFRSREEFIGAVNGIIGDRTDDEALGFISDMADTYDELHSSENEDWKRKYEQNDAEWRNKYRERFMSPTTEKDDIIEDEKETKKIKTYEDLFKSEV